MSILVTGGLGYIGSHTTIELLNSGEEVIVIDNLVNSKEVVAERINKITGKNVNFYNIDLLDEKKVDEVFKNNNIRSVIHFAALKAVGESCEKPLKYYTNK